MKSIIITGVTSGIGFECARQIAKIAPDAQIILTCRNLESGKQVIQKIGAQTGHKYLRCMLLDLESLASIREFAAQFSRQPDNEIIALINNAGIQIITQTYQRRF